MTWITKKAKALQEEGLRKANEDLAQVVSHALFDMSDTPRTDAVEQFTHHSATSDFSCIPASFARELEREVVQLRSEPIMHTQETDVLPNSHPLVWECVECEHCSASCHCSNNECMSTWVEWRSRILCGRCFAAVLIEHSAMDFADFETMANSKKPR